MFTRNSWFSALIIVGSLAAGSSHPRLSDRQSLEAKRDAGKNDKTLTDSELEQKLQSKEQRIFSSHVVYGEKQQDIRAKNNAETPKDMSPAWEKAPQMISQRSNIKSRIKIRRERRGDPEPTPETEKSSSEPERTSEPETNPNSTSEPEPEPEMWPEPEPDWGTAAEVWKAAWPVHVYGFGSILLLLAMISLFELVQIHVKSRRKTALKVSLLIMIFLFCGTRCIALFIDPYGSTGKVNPIVARILFSIGQPCIISSMSLLLMVLIDTTKMSIAPPTFQRVQMIIAVVVCHVILVLTTDIVVAFYVKTKILILICQIYFLVTGLILTIGYAKAGYKIAKNSSACTTRDRKMEKLKILIIIASVTGLVTVILTIYGAAGVFGIYSDVIVVEAWPWWSFQTIGRTLEVVMVIVLLLMNVNVSGSGHGIKQLCSNFCHKVFFKNKVRSADRLHVSSAVYTNSWMS